MRIAAGHLFEIVSLSRVCSVHTQHGTNNNKRKIEGVMEERESGNNDYNGCSRVDYVTASENASSTNCKSTPCVLHHFPNKISGEFRCTFSDCVSFLTNDLSPSYQEISFL